MSKQVASLPTFAYPTNVCKYTPVNTLQDVAATIQFLTSASITQFALVKIALYFSHKESKVANRTACEEQSACYFLENLRSLVRKTDHVLLLHTVMYFLLPTADVHGARIVQERLWEALIWRVHNIEAQVLAPASVHSGYSAYPLPCDDFEQCITASGLTNLEFALEDASTRTRAKDSDLSRLARTLGIPYLALLPHDIPLDVRQLLRPELALELHCYPLGCEQDMLTVAIADPQSSQVLDRLHRETGMRIFPVLAHPQELQIVLDKLI